MSAPTRSGDTEAAAAQPSTSSSCVELNVGGKIFTTSRATLEESQPQSMLAALASGRHGPPCRDAQVMTPAPAPS